MEENLMFFYNMGASHLKIFELFETYYAEREELM